MFIWKHKKFPMFARYYIPDSFVNWTIEMLDLPKKRIVWEGWVIEDNYGSRTCIITSSSMEDHKGVFL